MKFNDNLKYLRKMEGLTQEELAYKLNVSRQSVTKWESGQAVPDIEKIKEIAYMFSVSVDSLIGDIESKSTNKIKRKIDDIGWFALGFAMSAFFIIPSLSDFFFDLLKNDDLAIGCTITVCAIAFIIFIVALKRYLKDNEDRILNMKDDEKGKFERKQYIYKKYIISFIAWCIFCFASNIGFLLDEKGTFINEMLSMIIIGFIFDIIIGVYEYTKLKKRVKELNK